MKNIQLIRILSLAIAIGPLLFERSVIEAIGRKDIIDQQAIFTGTETLETERLILRQITIDDAEDMFRFTSKPEVETWNSVHATIQDTREFIETLQQKYSAKEPALWGVVDKRNNKLIGYCGFTTLQLSNSIIELEYALDTPYWGQGFMSEALKNILSFTFDKLKLNRILAFTKLNNERSERLLLKMGFKQEGLHREAGYSDGAFYDLKSFALVRQDYLAIGK